MLGLGLSVGTPTDGIEADALVVDSFLTLEQRASEARGKIVLFNQPFKGYGPTVAYRVNGASQAAEAGALAVLVRSVGLDGLRTPHTGMLTYREGVPDSRGGDQRRGRRPPHAHGGARRAHPSQADDGAPRCCPTRIRPT